MIFSLDRSDTNMNFYARRVTRPADLPSIDCMRPGTFHFVSKEVIISHLSRINANWTLKDFRAAYSKYHYEDAGAIVYGTTTFIRGTEAAPPHQTYQVKDAAAFVRYSASCLRCLYSKISVAVIDEAATSAGTRT